MPPEHFMLTLSPRQPKYICPDNMICTIPTLYGREVLRQLQRVRTRMQGATTSGPSTFSNPRKRLKICGSVLLFHLIGNMLYIYHYFLYLKGK